MTSANTTDAYVCPPGFHDWFTFAGESKFDFDDETELGWGDKSFVDEDDEPAADTFPPIFPFP